MESYISYLIYGISDEQFDLAETRMIKVFAGYDER